MSSMQPNKRHAGASRRATRHGRWIAGCTVVLLAAVVVLSAAPAIAKNYVEDFQGKSAHLDWLVPGSDNKACLTAGNGNGTIPECSHAPSEDQDEGQGALRLTQAKNNKAGAIISNFTFPMSEGIQVTFTTYTFGGKPLSNSDWRSGAEDGGDGMSFFLLDADGDNKTEAPGATGGALGYSCSHNTDKLDLDIGKSEGIAHGYIGLGMDEFGNYLNSFDNGTQTTKSISRKNYKITRRGIENTNNSGDDTYGQNPFGGGTAPDNEQQAQRIGLRGRGNTTWEFLHSKNPNYYSNNHRESTKKKRLQEACKSGEYKSSSGDWRALPFNYDIIPGAYKVLPGKLDQSWRSSGPITTPGPNNQRMANLKATALNDDRNPPWPITYRLRISTSGRLDFAYSYNNGDFQPVLENADITESNGSIPENLRFGFAASTGGASNVHEIACFRATPMASNTSAGANLVQGNRVLADTQFFLASYSANDWWGALTANPFVDDDGELKVSEAANWDAKCVLTPDEDQCTTVADDRLEDMARQKPEDRTLLSASDSGGVALEWSKIGSDAQGDLNASDGKGKQRLKWLRGERKNEQLQNPSGDLRARAYVLGDIINSSPTYVPAPSNSGFFSNSFLDKLHPSEEPPPERDHRHFEFVSDHGERQGVVYVGSNDGFVHGFRAGSTAEGDATANDGREMIAYMPRDVLADKIANLTDPLYSHDYLVDATPTAGDLFYGGAWHTWLVGGVGSAGREIYALDITDPAAFNEDQADKLVIGDWNQDNLSKLGHTVGRPIIERMHNGQWAVIFGNGLGSGSGGIYIGLVDKNDGSISDSKFIGTGKSAGIAYVSSVDLDGDKIADYLYAGDSDGNVWRFDVTSDDSNGWHVSKLGHSSKHALFIAKDDSNNRQPITTAITALSVKTDAGTRVMLYFGTGKVTPQSVTNPKLYATGQQTYYGLWDWAMDDWNSMSGTRYVSLDGQQTITRSKLLKQSGNDTDGSRTVNGESIDYRLLRTDKEVCWKDTASCDQYGWFYDLPGQGPDNGQYAGQGEQIIFNSTFVAGALVINTAIPPVAAANACNPGTQGGWTMAFDPRTGGGLSPDFFNIGYDGGDNKAVAAIKLDGVGQVTPIDYKGNTYIVTQTSLGTAKVTPPVNPHWDVVQGRLAWRELVSR